MIDNDCESLQKKRGDLYEKQWINKWIDAVNRFPLPEKIKYQQLSCSPNITMEYYLKNQDKPWNLYQLLMSNPNVTVDIGLLFESKLKIIKRDFIEDFMQSHNGVSSYEYHTDSLFLTENKLIEIIWQGVSGGKVTMDEILQYSNKPWSWRTLSKNSSIKMTDVLNHPDLPWDWMCLSLNPSITIDDVINNSDKPWNWYFVSKMEGITLEKILENPTLPWRWNAFCDSLDYNNVNVPFEFVLDNLDKPWNMHVLSRHRSITLADILQYPLFNWNWEFISENPSITMNDVNEHPELSWYWPGVTRNPSITMEDISNNVDKPWDWSYIAFNPNITPEFILNNKDKPFNWDFLSLNENVDIDFVLSNLDKSWSYSYFIFGNDLIGSKKKYIKEKENELKENMENLNIIQEKNKNIPQEIFRTISDYF